MKAVKIGNQYRIYDETIETFDELPAGVYSVCFHEMSGFWLESRKGFEINEKVYGVHPDKVQKVIGAFSRFNRNLGVILSGDKGIGKSLFAKMLCSTAVEIGIPVIVVDKFVPGIASYIESIDQEVIVLFDEFDKTFANIKTGNNEADPQAGLLSLFDGTSYGKKMFVITCNDLSKLNDYLVNRPGRFHYHFRFEYPDAHEITEYLKDHLQPECHDQIGNVIAFSRKVRLNYDCLRAIAFELSSGVDFSEAIKDLNIINMNEERYTIKLYFKDGTIMSRRRCYIDVFNGEDEVCEDMRDQSGREPIELRFCVEDIEYDASKGNMVVRGDKLRIEYNNYGEYTKEEEDAIKKLVPDFAVVTRAMDREIHYTV